MIDDVLHFWNCWNVFLPVVRAGGILIQSMQYSPDQDSQLVPADLWAYNWFLFACRKHIVGIFTF